MFICCYNYDDDETNQVISTAIKLRQHTVKEAKSYMLLLFGYDE